MIGLWRVARGGSRASWRGNQNGRGGMRIGGAPAAISAGTQGGGMPGSSGGDPQ
jgi:hypothetical protein